MPSLELLGAALGQQHLLMLTTDLQAMRWPDERLMSRAAPFAKPRPGQACSTDRAATARGVRDM